MLYNLNRINIIICLLSLIIFSLIGLLATEFILSSRWTNSLLVNPLNCPTKQKHSTIDFSVEYKYNSNCIRGSEIDNSLKFDYILLGDSFLFGLGNNEEDTLFDIIKREGYTVLNVSENATNPPEFLIKYKKIYNYGVRGSRVLISLFIGNDFQGISSVDNIHDLNHYNPSLSDSLSITTIPRIRYLISWLSYKLFSPNNYFIRKYSYLRDFRYDWADWYTNGNVEKATEMKNKKYSAITSDEEYFILSEINDRSTSKVVDIFNLIYSVNPETQLVIVLIPDRHYENGELGEKYNSFRKNIIHKLEGKFSVIDLHDLLEPNDYFTNDGHWNPSGHNKVAKYILNRLSK